MMTTQQLLQTIAQQNAAMQRPITPFSAPVPNLLEQKKEEGPQMGQALAALGGLLGNGSGGYGIGQGTADSTAGFDASVFNGGTYGGGLGANGTYASGSPAPFASFEAAPVTDYVTGTPYQKAFQPKPISDYNQIGANSMYGQPAPINMGFGRY